ncbi:hypothetical protein DFJ74DRAFT_17537 [Hyaloraphidium curvatum]|nr:hypothetical protein DFJ74DRAFT_17537 [Hyaloraphidium curvatum]
MGKRRIAARLQKRTIVDAGNGQTVQQMSYLPANQANYAALTHSRVLNTDDPEPIVGLVMDRSKPPPPSVRVVIHVDDARDNVFIAIVRALILGGNIPSGPSEITAMIMQWGVATSGLGGQTPQATVSSRISNHFKRCSECKPPRRPLLGVWTVPDSPRQARYFVDRENVPVGVLTQERIMAKPRSGLPIPRCRLNVPNTGARGAGRAKGASPTERKVKPSSGSPRVADASPAGNGGSGVPVLAVTNADEDIAAMDVDHAGLGEGTAAPALPAAPRPETPELAVFVAPSPLFAAKTLPPSRPDSAVELFAEEKQGEPSQEELLRMKLDELDELISYN